MVKETVKVTRFSLAMVTALGAMVAAGCSDNDNDNLVPLVATFITVNAGSNGQTGTAGQVLANPIVVHVTDQNSNALAGVSVAWAVVGAGGSVSVGQQPDERRRRRERELDARHGGRTRFVDRFDRDRRYGDDYGERHSGRIQRSRRSAATLQSVAPGLTSAPLVVKIANASNGVAIGGAGVSLDRYRRRHVERRSVDHRCQWIDLGHVDGARGGGSDDHCDGDGSIRRDAEVYSLLGARPLSRRPARLGC